MEGGNRIPRKGTEVEYEGKKYSSIRELCKALDIPYSQMVHKFYKTKNMDESVAWAKQTQEERYFYELWNQKYASLSDVAKTFGLNNRRPEERNDWLKTTNRE